MLGSVGLGLGSVGTAADAGGGGGGASSLKTLKAIWDFGAADNPAADNVFNMPTGNMRFVGSTTPLELPNQGFFESATTPGDSRIGADYIRRFFNVDVGVGGVVFDHYDGFDPTWAGSFRTMGHFVHEVHRVGFVQGTTETGPGAELLVAEMDYLNGYGQFNGTDVWPLVGTNDGAREDLQWQLYNEFDNAIGPRGALTGWGTWIGYPRILEHGTTAAFESQANFGGIALAAGDGIGWFIRRNGDDPPKGVFRWYSVDGDVISGKAGWEAYGLDGAGILTRLWSADPTNGFVVPLDATFDGAATFSGAVSFVPSAATPAVFTATVDFRTPGFYAFDTPAVAGKKFSFLAGRMLIETRDANLTTGPTLFLAQNGVDSSQSVSPAIATINSQAAPANISASWTVSGGLPDMTTFPMQLHVSVGAAGSGLTTCTGRVLVLGYYL